MKVDIRLERLVNKLGVKVAACRLLIAPAVEEDKTTDSGIILSSAVKQNATVPSVGYVLAAGPDTKNAQAGQYIAFNKGADAVVSIDHNELHLIHDLDVLFTFTPTNDE